MRNRLFHDLLPEMRAAELVIGNPGMSLHSTAFADSQNGPHFGAPRSCIAGIQSAGINLLSLANNHILTTARRGCDTQ